MSILEGFQKGSHGTYKYDPDAKEWIKVNNSAHDPNAGLNGPVWFPKGQTKYFDKALNREFNSLSEKKAFMREHKICQKAPDSVGDLNVPEAGLGKRYYSIPGVKPSSYYKYR